LGIDTGGTYTDAVLFDDVLGVLGSAKALTTRYDLAVGIRGAVEAVLAGTDRARDIRLVSLSTTLATNAIVEGQGSPICLLLLGYPPDALDLAGLRQAMGSDPVVFIQGGHLVGGEEQAALDIDAARQAILAHAPKVAAFAVSGYFAVRNPEHELRVRQLVRQLTGLPVTCGHELTSNLHAPRRALTAALNARLIPFLQQLILAVRRLLEEESIHAPLMVVKGDGSLVDARVALERPVETILSGPAASVVGAKYLSGEDDMLVVDMGGTTTDIALLRDGRPVLNVDGAEVGGWRTMVEAVAVHTFGLGGDSEVRLDDVEAGGLAVGPRRVVPLSLLAYQFPHVLDVLRRQLTRPVSEPYDGRFALRQRPLENGQGTLNTLEQEIWTALERGPVALSTLFVDSRRAYFLRQAVYRLVGRGLVVLSAFTPSDVAHVLGYQHDWSLEAAQLGGEIFCRQATAARCSPGGDLQALCQRVLQQVTLQAGRALVGVALAEVHGVDLNEDVPLRRLLVDQALAQLNGRETVLDVSLTLRRSLVAIGAPVSTYYPAVAGRLHTRLCIPPHAGIANAVGAVAGGVMQTVRVLIKPLDSEGGGYRVHLPTGIRDFPDLEEAAGYALQEASGLAEERARQAGAADVQVHSQRHDQIVNAKDLDIYLGSDITATGVGRPRLAEGVCPKLGV
jgi:N-methylhydantoinase A/oxoprolinase/acetone carboxylase beta subunit